VLLSFPNTYNAKFVHSRDVTLEVGSLGFPLVVLIVSVTKSMNFSHIYVGLMSEYLHVEWFRWIQIMPMSGIGR
jgi:hypothetical protein